MKWNFFVYAPVVLTSEREIVCSILDIKGQVWSDALVNYVYPEGTEWNGDKCLAYSGGKAW